MATIKKVLSPKVSVNGHGTREGAPQSHLTLEESQKLGQIRSTLTTQNRFCLARKEMNDKLIEREGEIDLVLTALICGENPLLVGPPGTGKSLLLDSLLAWMGGAKRFTILFTKFTTPEEVFGPISVQGLKADVYRRVTTGKLPEADVAFADEIFKASSAILNTMLRILNERVYENGDGTLRKVPLKICVAASNEWPGDQEGGKELGALFDRFLFRKKVRPIVTKGGREKLLWETDLTPQFSTTISPAEIDKARTVAMAFPWDQAAQDAFMRILQELAKEGICPGDRRQRKSRVACQAYAYLCGASSVQTEHLEILTHTLWDDPQEQPEKVGKVVAKIANPLGMAINEKLLAVEDVLAKSVPTEAVPKLQQIQKELAGMPADPRRDKAVKYIGENIKSLYDRVIGITTES